MKEEMVLALDILEGDKDECVELNHAELTEVLKHFCGEVTVHPVSTDINDAVRAVKDWNPEVADVEDELIIREISKYAHVIVNPVITYLVTPRGIETLVRDDIYDEYYKWCIGSIDFNGKKLRLFVSEYDLLCQQSFHVDRPYAHVEPVLTFIEDERFVYVPELLDHYIDLIAPGDFKMIHIGKESFVVYDDFEPEYVIMDGSRFIRYTKYLEHKVFEMPLGDE